MQQYFSMSGGKTFGLDPKINGYQNLTFGPFYPELDSLRIEYSGTNWTSSDCNLLWRYRDVAKEGCVQCYTDDWSGPPLDCSITTNSTTLLSRNTTMLCGVLLGKPQITPTVAPTATPTVTPSATISEPAIMPRKLTTNFPLIYTTSVPSPNNSSYQRHPPRRSLQHPALGVLRFQGRRSRGNPRLHERTQRDAVPGIVEARRCPQRRHEDTRI
ncbi:hypothetical protein B5807_10587 [Epicoccum nigrum]|uniref:Uncharacterized protein n=1 Tax=Epicoccum nigrum TaxID=105696 RepID=A0A1Y2LLS6_EPING|nr:hypothetical protein B5807_10587 [Epicoccum nigrum]